ncbi:MAG: glycoside hydrolase family 97 C-terminal domain-containing protein [Colwellia sp.]
MYLQSLPTQWHESKYIAGFLGKLAVFARRHKNTWFVASINGEDKEKDLALDLSFLAGKRAQIILSGSHEREIINQNQYTVLSYKFLF